MDISDMIDLALNGGISAVLAAVVIYWYRSDSQERLRSANERTEREREDKTRVLNVVSENASAMNEMANALRDNAGATRELRQTIQQLLMRERDRRVG